MATTKYERRIKIFSIPISSYESLSLQTQMDNLSNAVNGYLSTQDPPGAIPPLWQIPHIETKIECGERFVTVMITWQWETTV